jgi:hypothetical protein
MTRFILLFFTIHFSFFTTQSQDISFFKENITMQIEKDYFYVTGIYYLQTRGDTSVVLVYPLPVHSLYGEVDTVVIFNMTTDRFIQPLASRKDAIVFKAGFSEHAQVSLLISYRQKLLGNRAEYILESTASWREPLEQADYQLIVPKETKITSFSIPPDESVESGDETIYYWTRKNYMPPVNMIFEFE